MPRRTTHVVGGLRRTWSPPLSADRTLASQRFKGTLGSSCSELGEPIARPTQQPPQINAVEDSACYGPRRASSASSSRPPSIAANRTIGTPLEPRNVLRRFEALAERAGLRGVHLHTLRHSAASFLLAVGTHTKVVQEHLGHSSYAITADIYSHVAPAQQREAADKLGQAIHW
jgi:hypothetical protein